MKTWIAGIGGIAIGAARVAWTDGRRSCFDLYTDLYRQCERLVGEGPQNRCYETAKEAGVANECDAHYPEWRIKEGRFYSESDLEEMRKGR